MLGLAAEEAIVYNSAIDRSPHQSPASLRGDALWPILSFSIVARAEWVKCEAEYSHRKSDCKCVEDTVQMSLSSASLSHNLV